MQHRRPSGEAASLRHRTSAQLEFDGGAPEQLLDLHNSPQSVSDFDNGDTLFVSDWRRMILN